MADITREEVQEQIVREFSQKRFLLADVAMGVGKTRPGLEIIRRWRAKKPDLRIAIISSTIGIQKSWPNEANLMGVSLEGVDMFAWTTIVKIEGHIYDFVIADEVHKITERNSKFFRVNQIATMLLLTGTMPIDEWKKKWILRHCRGNIVSVPVEEAVDAGILNPFNLVIHRIGCTKEEWNAYIRACQFLMNAKKVPVEIRALRRMEVIYSMQSKIAFSQRLLGLMDKKERTLIFAARREHTHMLCSNVYYHDGHTESLQSFLSEDIDRLAVCEMLNDSITVPNLTTAFVHQIKGSPVVMLQRLGRLLRLPDKNQYATMHIVIVRNTQEEAWLFKATKTINKDRIKIIDYD